MAIRKKSYLTTIKMCIVLMIDNSPYLYHWQVGVLPSTGNSITNAWKSAYQALVITHVKKQCIIVTKDFITKGEVRRNDIQGLECPVYRIKKAKGFDVNNMATIRTIVEKLK